MIIHFHISYKTMFGEQIVVNIQKDNEEVKFPLTTLDGERWSYDWCVEPTQGAGVPWCRICTSRMGTAVPHWRTA